MAVPRSELPTGTVTFLFTDIEGSTRLLHEHGAAYGDLLAEHRRLLREAFAAHAGVEVDTQGDAFFVAFARATDAVAAAADSREALESGPIRVRIGIHTGEPQATDEATSRSTFTGLRGSRRRRMADRSSLPKAAPARPELQEIDLSAVPVPLDPEEPEVVPSTPPAQGSSAWGPPPESDEPEEAGSPTEALVVL